MISMYLIWLTLASLPYGSPYQYLAVTNEGLSPYGGRSLLNKYAAKIADVPYHVLIVYGNMYCSGSLVWSKIVVTAASCLNNRKTQTTFVKVGANSIIDIGQIINVTDIKLHEYYGYLNERDNDIAMLVLQNHVHFGPKVKKVILIDPNTVLETGVTLNVSGYAGESTQTKYANRLIWAEMTVMNTEECIRVYHNLVTLSNFCVKYQPERNLSDNGGPAVFKDVLVGVVSFAATAGGPHVALLTNVSYFHNWILLNTKRFLQKYCVPGTETIDFSLSNEGNESS